MNGPIPADIFIEVLRGGCARTIDYVGRLTEYHGGPIETEYVLTSDIARAFLDLGYPVRVEFQNKRLVNAFTQRKSHTPRFAFGLQRTDVVVTAETIVPYAMVEVKIGVGGTLTPIQDDLAKICNTLDSVRAPIAANTRVASVFQVHVRGNADDTETDRIEKRVAAIEQALNGELKTFNTAWPDFTFSLVPLQEETEGIVATSVDEYPDGTAELGENGHATRYYAVIISSTREPAPEDRPLWNILSKDTSKPTVT